MFGSNGSRSKTEHQVPAIFRSYMIQRLIFLCTIVCASSLFAEPNSNTLRIGHFATITHAPALVAHALSREGKGWYEARVPGISGVEWFIYNTGNGAVEALKSNSIDVTFSGPTPLFAAQARYGLDSVKILSGVASGGSALLVQGDGRIAQPADFRGRRVATPEIGNSQDIAARAWLMEQGFSVTMGSGDVHILPAQYADQLLLFKKGELDAVWVVEPWVSRFEAEANAKVFFEDPRAVTTVLATTGSFATSQSERVAAITRATAELIQWMQAHPDEAQTLARRELLELTKREMAPELFAKAWHRLTFAAALNEDALLQTSLAAARTGLFRKPANVTELVLR